MSTDYARYEREYGREEGWEETTREHEPVQGVKCTRVYFWIDMIV